MKGFRILQGAAVSLACWGIVLPQSRLLAAAPTTEAGMTRPVQTVPETPRPAVKKSLRLAKAVRTVQPAVADVGLSAGGTVTGQVVDPHGRPLEGQLVSIRTTEGEVAKAVTDRNGNFVVSSLAGGVYHVAAGQGQNIFRFWAPETAPPSARPQAVVVSGKTVVRAQNEERNVPILRRTRLPRMRGSGIR
jgi:hypothetical protein